MPAVEDRLSIPKRRRPHAWARGLDPKSNVGLPGHQGVCFLYIKNKKHKLTHYPVAISSKAVTHSLATAYTQH